MFVNNDCKPLREGFERRVRVSSRLFICLIPVMCLWSGLASAEDKKTKAEPGIVEQLEIALANAAAKVEKGFTDTVKQIQEIETPKKVSKEVKRSAESLGQKVEEAGRKLKQSFKSE
jgi:hypothetical protein